jgi:hypothetical protein
MGEVEGDLIGLVCRQGDECKRVAERLGGNMKGSNSKVNGG